MCYPARENGAFICLYPDRSWHIVKCFKGVQAQHAFEFGQDITTAAEFATQMITTAIVNAVGTYVVRNMKQRSTTDDEAITATTTPKGADVFF